MTGMKLPFSWLKEFVEISETPEEIAHMLTMAGLEVDSVEPMPLGFSGVVVGEVVETTPHPEADKLCIATVSDGSETFQVVCGASNCRKGLKTPFAKVGARVGEIKIKRAKLRGTESFGMLCAKTELGIGTDDSGIAELSPESVVGKDLAEIYGETILEISLTPNLGHCASALGVAREIAAATGRPLSMPILKVEEGTTPIDASVEVQDQEGCPRYACRVMSGVKVAPSPDWVKLRLEACGQRAINNVVDATNLVMLELGHPLHAFDYDKVEGKKIIVRPAKEDEPFVTLDGEERTLEENTLLICDQEKPVAIAGVMGGANSEVSDGTTNLLIEAAYFDPSRVRRASKATNLSTESSRRFERGCDPNMVVHALDRVVGLIEGTVAKGVIDQKASDFPHKELEVRASRVNQVLGTALSSGEVTTLLTRLQFEVLGERDGIVSVQVPTFRSDVTSEIDLVEEVGRLYGYHNIPKKAPLYRTSTIPHTPLFLFERKIRERLLGQGLQELITNSLIGKKMPLPHLPEEAWVEVLNPSAAQHSVLRASLLPSLLEVVRHNRHNQVKDVNGFEIGRVHFRVDEEYQEQPVAAVVMTDAEFVDIKGIFENIASSLGLEPIEVEGAHLDLFHPYGQAHVMIDGMRVGFIGEVHPAYLRANDIESRVLFGTLNLYDLMAKEKKKTKIDPLPQYPGSERDWTITVDEAISHGQMIEAIGHVPSRLLKNVELLAIYRSERVGSGKKNVTYRFSYRDDRKTVSVEAVEKEHTRMMDSVKKTLGV